MAFRHRSLRAIVSFTALRALLMACDPQPASAFESFTQASPGMLRLLKEQHHASHGLFVTIPPGQFELSANSDLAAALSDAPVAPGSGLSAKQMKRFERYHQPDKPLRIRGAFGVFSGRVTSFDEAGLTGLHPDGRYGPRVAPPSQPLSWSQVDRMERRGSSVGVCAAWGAGIIGAGMGAMGAAIATTGLGLSSGGDSGEIMGATAAGVVVGALAGATLGGLIGSFVPRWHVVFDRKKS